jgi:hypothetical protein
LKAALIHSGNCLLNPDAASKPCILFVLVASYYLKLILVECQNCDLYLLLFLIPIYFLKNGKDKSRLKVFQSETWIIIGHGSNTKGRLHMGRIGKGKETKTLNVVDLLTAREQTK